MTQLHEMPLTWRRPFQDRHEAGQELATRLEHLRSQAPTVLGLPRSGVPVAAEVARLLDAPLDVVLVRKLAIPNRREMGMGALGEGGVRILIRSVVDDAEVTAEEVTAAERRERAELNRQAACYRKVAGAHPVEVRDRLCIVVDDAIVTGGTMRAAVRVLRSQGASRIVLAAPVGSADAVDALAAEADEVVVVARPVDLRTVAPWYRDFPSVRDDDVVELLRQP